MAFVIYAWGLGRWIVYTQLVFASIAFEYYEHSLSLHLFSNYLFAIFPTALETAL